MARYGYGMYNFQKLNETTSLCCNNSSENSVPKRYGEVFSHVTIESYLVSDNVAEIPLSHEYQIIF